MSARRALLSVFDKNGITELAKVLHDLGWEIVSSGGTAKAIAGEGVPVVVVSEVTVYPIMLGHRVVTLHPKIHGGILADLDEASHRADLETHDIQPPSLHWSFSTGKRAGWKPVVPRPGAVSTSPSTPVVSTGS